VWEENRTHCVTPSRHAHAYGGNTFTVMSLFFAVIRIPTQPNLSKPDRNLTLNIHKLKEFSMTSALIGLKKT